MLFSHEIRWKLHCQVLVIHVTTEALEVEEKGKLKNSLKLGKFSFPGMVDHEIFTYLKSKKQIILVVNRRFKIFHF